MGQQIELPGMVGMHEHLRGMPSDNYKETFESGTKAAAAGGVLVVGDMGNNKDPYRINNIENLAYKRALMRPPGYESQRRQPDFEGIYVDSAVFYTHRPEDDNIGTFERAGKLSYALKFYMEPTTGNTQTYDPRDFKEGAEEWWRTNPGKPIIVHTEDETIADALHILGHPDPARPLHVAHISTRFQLEAIRRVRRMREANVTSEITGHHRYLDEIIFDELGWYAREKPLLGTPEDREYLWSHLDEIDVFADDHAPHMDTEKDRAQAENPEGHEHGTTCYGVPGLEVFLPLLLHDVMRGDLSMETLIDKFHTAPARILNIKPDPRNKITVDMETYQFGEYPTFSKASYKHFAGRSVTGRVVRAELHGDVIYENGEFVNNYGTGQVLTPAA